MRLRLLLPVFAALLASCATHPTAPASAEAPLTPKTAPAAYTAYVLETVDTNKDGTITLVEWTTAGGDQRSFLLADANKDGVVTRTELIRLSSNAQFFDFLCRRADLDKNNRLTPREFRSAGGVRVLRFEF